MRVAVRCAVASLLLALPAFPFGKSRRVKEIDSYCGQVQKSLAAATPFFFSGPDPWTELDDFPEGIPDPAVAYVYTVGPEIRKVLLRVADPDDGWAEEVTYFYREDGSLARLTRRLQHPAANLILQEVSYYANGRRIKDLIRHHALAAGKPDLARFDDPGAPIFWTVDELPFGEIDLWRQLA